MRNGQIDARVFFAGKTDTYDVGLVGVERSFFFLAIRLIRCRFKIKSNNGSPRKIFM